MAPKAPSAPPTWNQEKWPRESCRVLTIDQSLVNSGWALLDFGNGKAPRLLECGTIHTRPIDGLKGFADSFSRAEQLFAAFRGLFMWLEPTIILHEMPALMGVAASRNQEAAVASAMSLRCAAVSLGHRTVGMMQVQHVRKWMTGSGRATKQMVREQVEKAVVIDRPINEHISDALALALTAARDGSLSSLLVSSRLEPKSIGVVR